ncbi:MAG: SHOCT domain-containing protein [Actinobacteria bacterium]|nr:SHOCT domain-containing protein [Actinomycetota bacterium]
MMMDGCGGGMLLGSLLFLVLIVGGIWLAVRAFQGDSGSSATGSSAMGVLEERYARGEIDREEFEDRRRVLES